MQIRKEIVLFCSLIILSVSLLIAADFSSINSTCAIPANKKMPCCCEQVQPKAESPWNFITSGLLHLSV